MRPTCTFCARKHIAQASALLGEARQGYPEHVWLAIGHLAEASEELLAVHPELANEIRNHRKRLETEADAGRWYDVPVVELITKVSQVARGVLPTAVPAVGAPIDPPLTSIQQAVAGCPPCEVAKQARRREATRLECALIGDDNSYVGRLVIMSPLSDFKPAYSLCSVILDQAHAARLCGYRVHVWVSKGCDVTKLPALPPGLTVEDVLPTIEWKHDEVVPANVEAIISALEEELLPMYDKELGVAPFVITHDLVFQAWYIDFAVAIHRLAARGFGDHDGSTWWHMVHSSVGGRPQGDVAQWRARLPSGHRLLAINFADVPFLRGYYQVPADKLLVDALLNPRDPRSFLRMTPDASYLVTRFQLLSRDVVQFYPLSGTRMIQKGVDKVIQLFGALKRAGATVCLVVANAHSNNDETKHAIRYLQGLALSHGLAPDDVVFTSEAIPASEVHGLDGDSVRSMFAISNLFAFPTISEAGSLVLMEAALSQCLLVLNDSLPCLADYVPRSKGVWVPWGSLKGVGQPFNVDQVAATLLEKLAADERLSIRQAILDRSSIEAYGQNLHQLMMAQRVVRATP